MRCFASLTTAGRLPWPLVEGVVCPLEFSVVLPLPFMSPPSGNADLMSRRFVNQFGHQELIDQIFLASNKQLRPNRAGNLYLQVDLSDRSGSIGARLWNASDTVYRSFED